MKKFLITLLIGVLLTTGAASAFGVRVGESEADVTAYRTERETDEGKADLPEETVSSELETVWEPQSVHLLSAGDDLIHSSIYEQAAARSQDGGYDFTYLYENVADYLSGADIATVNQETVIVPSHNPDTYRAVRL